MRFRPDPLNDVYPAGVIPAARGEYMSCPIHDLSGNDATVRAIDKKHTDGLAFNHSLAPLPRIAIVIRATSHRFLGASWTISA